MLVGDSRNFVTAIIVPDFRTFRTEWKLNGATDACVIKPADDEGYIGVVMPMRL